MGEIWKSIEGFEGLYEVSNLGRVKALDRYVLNNGGMQHKKERILKQNIPRKHCIVVLCKEGKTYSRLVHRLVAIAFIPNPENKPVVDHIDTNPLNNCVDNLRWATVQENALNPLTRQHLSQAKMGHQYWGRPLTAEERKKISDATKGRVFTDEHKKRLSEAHKNIKQSEEAKRKNAEAHRGKKLSEEARRKIREKSTGRYKGKTWKIIGGKRVWITKTEDSD